jgi:hypothetical protein
MPPRLNHFASRQRANSSVDRRRAGISSAPDPVSRSGHRDCLDAADPAGRRFDLVLFAASFPWVNPAVALPKICELLDDGGKLALSWNRLRPTSPTRAEFEETYADYMDVETRSDDGNPGEVVDMISGSGFTVTERTYPHALHYSAQQRVDIAFTFSNQLLVARHKADELRARLIERIGSAGVAVGGDGVAIIATPR